ncbi:hypothetical protein [Haloplanus litoreus]|uniref:hypothetical protein n=1 Tax=Haloplanus litoreus TaxID=767515 RepID=UPI003A923F4D
MSLGRLQQRRRVADRSTGRGDPREREGRIGLDAEFASRLGGRDARGTVVTRERDVPTTDAEADDEFVVVARRRVGGRIDAHLERGGSLLSARTRTPLAASESPVAAATTRTNGAERSATASSPASASSAVAGAVDIYSSSSSTATS